MVSKLHKSALGSVGSQCTPKEGSGYRFQKKFFLERHAFFFGGPPLLIASLRSSNLSTFLVLQTTTNLSIKNWLQNTCLEPLAVLPSLTHHIEPTRHEIPINHIIMPVMLLASINHMVYNFTIWLADFAGQY